jgi:acyl transferase domain-containing protein
MALVARDGADAMRQLLEPAPREVCVGQATGTERSLAFLFPGVGDHHVGMAAGLYDSEPEFRAALDSCADLLAEHLGRDIREILYPADLANEPPKERRTSSGPDLRRLLGQENRPAELDRTTTAQPLVFAVEYALARLLVSWGIRPGALAGHSLGEYVAACLAGVLTEADAAALVARRAELIETAPEGAMVVALLPADKLAGYLDDEVSLAAADGPQLSVAGGSVAGVTRLEERLRAEGVASRRLPTRHAFHSWMLEPLEEPLRDTVAGFFLNPPAVPMLSNVTGTWLPQAEATSPRYWARHMTQTVRFADLVGELWRLPAPVLLEVGVGRTLGTLVRQHPDRGPDGVVLSTLPTVEARHSDLFSLLTAVGQLWVEGVDVDLQALLPDIARQRPLIPQVFQTDAANPASSGQ